MASTGKESFIVEHAALALKNMMHEHLKEKLMNMAEEWVDLAVDDALKDFVIHMEKMFQMERYGQELRILVERK